MVAWEARLGPPSGDPPLTPLAIISSLLVNRIVTSGDVHREKIVECDVPTGVLSRIGTYVTFAKCPTLCATITRLRYMESLSSRYACSRVVTPDCHPRSSPPSVASNFSREDGEASPAGHAPRSISVCTESISVCIETCGCRVLNLQVKHGCIRARRSICASRETKPDKAVHILPQPRTGPRCHRFDIGRGCRRCSRR